MSDDAIRFFRVLDWMMTLPSAGLERVNQIRDESQLRRLLQGAARKILVGCS